LQLADHLAQPSLPRRSPAVSARGFLATVGRPSFRLSRSASTSSVSIVPRVGQRGRNAPRVHNVLIALDPDDMHDRVGSRRDVGEKGGCPAPRPLWALRRAPDVVESIVSHDLRGPHGALHLDEPLRQDWHNCHFWARSWGWIIAASTPAYRESRLEKSRNLPAFGNPTCRCSCSCCESSRAKPGAGPQAAIAVPSSAPPRTSEVNGPAIQPDSARAPPRHTHGAPGTYPRRPVGEGLRKRVEDGPREAVAVGVLSTAGIRQFGAYPPHDHLERRVGPLCDSHHRRCAPANTTAVPRRQHRLYRPHQEPTRRATRASEARHAPLGRGVCPQVRATRKEHPLVRRTWLY